MVDYKADKEKMMSDWWQNPLGQCVLTQEKSVLQSLCSHFHGYCQLQLGVTQQQLPDVIHSAQQKIMAPTADVNGDINALPFKSHSLDTVLLSHALEFSSDPHQVLREVERVL